MSHRGLMTVALAMFLASNAFAQPFAGRPAGAAESPEWQFRHELFQMLLEERGLTMADSLDAALSSPRESVVVMVGQLSRVRVADSGKLLRFVAEGGTLLAASDRTSTIGVIASFTSAPITSSDAETRYQNLPDCLRVTDLDQSHPLMQGVNEIVVNRSGWLVLHPGSSMNWEVVAKVPETCSPRRSRGQPLIAVSQSGLSGAGTMIVAADPSLITNSMMWHGDNAILAIHLSEMLCHGEKRRLAFLVDGQPLPSYRASPLLQETERPQPPPRMPPPPGPPPKPTWESLLRMANAVIQNVEESNILNEAIVNHPRYPNPRLYPIVVLLSLAVIIAAWLLSKLTHTAAIRPPPMPIRAMQTARDMFRQRTVVTREYGVAAQTLAREFLHEMSGESEMPVDWRRFLAQRAMPSSVERLKKSVQRDLAAIVELAASPDAPHISSRRLQKIGVMIRTLRELHREAALEAAQEKAGASHV
jgi:hypothetical protein